MTSGGIKMASFEKAFKIVLKNEFGYVNHPKDPGGETFDGIDRRDNANWSGWQRVDSFKSKGLKGKVLTNALRADISIVEARDKYYRDIWNRLRMDEVISQSVANNIYDAYINPGARTVKVVQRLLKIIDDGIIGTTTMRAINQTNPQTLVTGICDWRVEYYLGRSQTLKETFLMGWLARTEEMRLS